MFVIFLPYLGVFVYLIARGHKMTERDIAQAQAQKASMDEYVRSVAGSGGGVAAELEKLVGPQGPGRPHPGRVRRSRRPSSSPEPVCTPDLALFGRTRSRSGNARSRGD